MDKEILFLLVVQGPEMPSLEMLSVDSMLNPSVTNKCIWAAERLFVRADFAADFLLERIVNGIFVTCEVVRT